MDQFTRAPFSIGGNYSGNAGNHNVFGSINLTINMNGLSDMTNFGSGNQSREFRAGDAASRPYRFIPYNRNSIFTGRGNLIESVGRFSEHEGHNRVALHGLGGSGKTQIALEYAHRRASEPDYNIFWVQGSGVVKFCAGFRDIAQRVRIPPANARTEEEGVLLGVKSWFEGLSSGDWILVIDGVDNEATFDTNSPIAEFIPQGAKGTLLFTTRSRQVASRQGCRVIDVGEMGEGEARELFSKHFHSWDTLGEEEKQVTGMILGWVHHLPLAIVGSAALMIETATRPSVYSTILQENGRRMRALLSQQFYHPQRETDASKSILGTYFVTFDQITQQMPQAADLLRLMAFFDTRNIPEELLRKCGLEGMDDPAKFRCVIGKLREFSLITIVQRENKTLYSLHRLVQLSLQVYLPTEELDQRRAAALHVISRVFPRDQNEWRYIGPAYIPHALAVTRDSTGPIAEELCFRIGRCFLDMASYSHAETQFRRCIALRKESRDYDWDNEGHRRFMLLGMVNTLQGKHDKSETMYRCALEGSEKAFGLDHPDTLTSLSALATVLRIQGKYDQSEEVNRRALEGYERVYGPDHPVTLGSLDNPAIVLREQGRSDESETMDQHTPERLPRKRTGPQPPGRRALRALKAAVFKKDGSRKN